MIYSRNLFIFFCFFFAVQATDKLPKILCADCNVILISIDSLRQDHLGLYGYKRDTSPNLDAWSRDAFVFNNYITSAFLTPISELSLHSGLYASKHGMISFASEGSNKIQLLAEILKTYGYNTAAIGSSPEFNMDCPPLADPPCTLAPIEKTFRRGFDLYQPAPHFKKELNSPPPSANTFRDLPHKTKEFLSQKHSKKFFLWMPIGSVHWPYNLDNKPRHFADKNYMGLLAHDILSWGMLSTIVDGELFGPMTDHIQGQKLNQNDTQFIIDRYDDGIYYTDSFLKDIFALLKQQNLEKNTIVVVASEHGEALGERGYFAHYDIFSTEVHTPLIIKIPKLPGGRINHLISSVDVLPTLLDLLGLSQLSERDGISFLPTLAVKNSKESSALLTTAPRASLFIERTPLWEEVISGVPINGLSGDPNSSAVRNLAEFRKLDKAEHFFDVAIQTAQWKLIYRKSRNIQAKYSWWNFFRNPPLTPEEFELYDLIADPREKTNLFSKQPKVVEDLKKELFNWIKKVEPLREKTPTNLPGQPYF